MTDKYKILEKINNLYKLNLSDFIKIYLVFSLNKLYKTIDNLLLD